MNILRALCCTRRPAQSGAGPNGSMNGDPSVSRPLDLDLGGLVSLPLPQP